MLFFFVLEFGLSFKSELSLFGDFILDALVHVKPELSIAKFFIGVEAFLLEQKLGVVWWIV